LRNPATVDRWFIPLFIGLQTIRLVAQDFAGPSTAKNLASPLHWLPQTAGFEGDMKTVSG